MCFISILKTSKADCFSRPDHGPCSAFSVRHYYDSQVGDCKKFIYGGCRGNGNNYVSESDCHNACGWNFIVLWLVNYENNKKGVKHLEANKLLFATLDWNMHIG